MHIHICPVEITAALMTVEHGLPYVRYKLCAHAASLKDAIMKRRPITIWKRINKSGLAEHNHIEDGHVETETPTPINDVQKKSWEKSKWNKQHGYLENNCVVVKETV